MGCLGRLSGETTYYQGIGGIENRDGFAKWPCFNIVYATSI